MKIYSKTLIPNFDPVLHRVIILDEERREKTVTLQTLLHASKQELSLIVEQDTPTIAVPFLQASQRVVVLIDGVRVQETVYFTRQGQYISFVTPIVAGTWVLVEAFPYLESDRIFEITLTSTQTTIACSFVLTGSLRVFVGGVMFHGGQYTISERNLTFLEALPTGTWIRIEKQ